MRASGYPAPTAEILVVDDNPINLSLLTRILAGEGYEVRSADNGAAALEAAFARAPDILLLDINMPGANGFEVCEALKTDPRTRSVPVIFISALDAIGDKVAAFDAGGVDYVTKPFQIKEVLVRVATQLTLHRQHRELEEQRRELFERHAELQKLHRILRGYVSGRAWDSIVSGATSLEIQPPTRETLTILVSDIVSFVQLSERLSPGSLLADLDTYMTRVAGVVSDHGGQIDKFLGDGVLAFFKEAPAALRAACQLQRSIAAFNAERGASGAPPFHTRVGLATGPVVLASLGSGSRREFTIIGDSVNLASRLQSDAAPGGVLMDEATYVAAGRPAEAVSSLLPIRGKSEPVAVHELPPDALAKVAPAAD
jgi:class 3 adenylate cyclase